MHTFCCNGRAYLFLCNVMHKNVRRMRMSLLVLLLCAALLMCEVANSSLGTWLRHGPLVLLFRGPWLRRLTTAAHAVVLVTAPSREGMLSYGPCMHTHSHARMHACIYVHVWAQCHTLHRYNGGWRQRVRLPVIFIHRRAHSL